MSTFSPVNRQMVWGPQMVWEWVWVCVSVSVSVSVSVCACVCACVRVCMCVHGMNLKYTLRWHINISLHSVLCQCYTQAHAHTHPQTIWGQRTNRVKSGYCPEPKFKWNCQVQWGDVFVSKANPGLGGVFSTQWPQIKEKIGPFAHRTSCSQFIHWQKCETIRST